MQFKILLGNIPLYSYNNPILLVNKIYLLRDIISESMQLIAIQTNLEKECVRGTNEPGKALQFQKVKTRVSF